MLGNICVTGATGFIGSHFVREWQKTRSGTIFALVRPGAQVSGQARLSAALETARKATGETDDLGYAHVDCLDADIRHPFCGLTPDRIEHLRKNPSDVFWHFASDLRFEDNHSETIHQTNIDGASNALDLALATGARRFVYISTAYVCGRNGGVIEEALPGGDLNFSNGYEASKAQAERMLFERCRAAALPLTILRPSIVVGPRATKCLEGSQTGLFSLVHAIMWVRSSQMGHGQRVRVAAIAQAEVNFIPVDCVVADMLGLARSGFGDQCIYHLTSSASPTVGQCWQALARVTGLDIIDLAAPGSFEPKAVEQLIMRRVGFFMSYINVARRFKRSLAPAWTLDAHEIEAYVRKAVERITDPKHLPSNVQPAVEV